VKPGVWQGTGCEMKPCVCQGTGGVKIGVFQGTGCVKPGVCQGTACEMKAGVCQGTGCEMKPGVCLGTGCHEGIKKFCSFTKLEKGTIF
jgi:hypothetical protein